MKRVFPFFWFGFLAFLLLINLFAGTWRKAPAFLLIPLIMAGFGFFLFKGLVWDLVDEVYDCGDHLLIRNDGEEASVLLSQVVNVSSTTFVNPPRITLRLGSASKFGTDVTFSPPRAFFYKPFAANPIAEDLMMRVDKARHIRYRSAP
jgi:hypothetical protein